MASIPVTEPGGNVEEAVISVGPAMSLTLPESIYLYTISEDQLELVCRGGRDNSLDWCLGLAGIGIGFSQNIINSAKTLNAGNIPSWWDMVLAVTSIIVLAIAITKFFEHRKNATSIEVLRTAIKSGKKFIMRLPG